jgi:hypothetical protein
MWLEYVCAEKDIIFRLNIVLGRRLLRLKACVIEGANPSAFAIPFPNAGGTFFFREAKGFGSLSV